MLKIDKFTDVCMTGGMHYYDWRYAFSQLIFNLKCCNSAGLLNLTYAFYCLYSFIIFDFFKFSAAILQNGLLKKYCNFVNFPP